MELNLSARTSSIDVQNNLETNLERHSRKTYGPPIGKRLVYFIDDLNLPQVSIYLHLIYLISHSEKFRKKNILLNLCWE